MSTTTAMTALHAVIDPLPGPADRAWAWCYAGHQVAAAEIGQCAPTDPVPEAIWAYGALLDALDDLASTGAITMAIPLPDLTRDQAHDLLGPVLEQVIHATGDVDHATEDEVLAFLRLQPAAVDAYVFHVGHLPNSDDPS